VCTVDVSELSDERPDRLPSGAIALLSGLIGLPRGVITVLSGLIGLRSHVIGGASGRDLPCHAGPYTPDEGEGWEGRCLSH